MLKDRVFWNIPEGIYTDGKNWYDSQQICRIFTFFYVKEYMFRSDKSFHAIKIEKIY